MARFVLAIDPGTTGSTVMVFDEIISTTKHPVPPRRRSLRFVEKAVGSVRAGLYLMDLLSGGSLMLKFDAATRRTGRGAD
jgi:hypothetical protein